MGLADEKEMNEYGVCLDHYEFIWREESQWPLWLKKKKKSIAISELYGREFCPKIKLMDLFFMHFVQCSDPLRYDNDKEFV